MPALAMPRLLSGVRRTAYASPEASTRSASRPGSGSSGTRRSTPNWYSPTTARVPAAAVCSTAVRRRCLEEVTGAATQRIGHGLGGRRDAPADAAAAGADGGCRWAGGAGSGCHRLPLDFGSGLVGVTQRRIPVQPPCPQNRPSPPLLPPCRAEHGQVTRQLGVAPDQWRVAEQPAGLGLHLLRQQARRTAHMASMHGVASSTRRAGRAP